MEVLSDFADLERYNNTETSTVSEDGRVKVRSVTLYDTVIVVADWSNGKLSLNNGGYKTPVTKKRMNEALSSLDLTYGVVQRSGEWFLIDRRDKSVVKEFIDGYLVIDL